MGKTMSKIINFPRNFYRYDFSVPEILQHDAADGGYSAGDFSGISYYLDDESINGIFGSGIDPLRLDWLDLAMAVYLADRLSPREAPRNSDHVWRRHFAIKIAVREPERWNDDALQTALENLLSFFTDDDWQFEFVPYMAPDRIRNAQMKLPLPASKTPRVALFSGGLDSFSGAASELHEDFESPFIFISGTTNRRQRGGQRKQIKALVKIFPKREIIHYTVGFGINWRKVDHPREETSQRTRGFMFMTLGAVAALNAGARELEIYENGVGAINLPYDFSQVGAMNSRSVSPSALIRMENFIEQLTGESFRISNRCLFQTKGEMCRSEISNRLGGMIKETFSCDGFPVRAAGKPQCGICTSCLLRRLSLEAAGLSRFDESEYYLTDLTGPVNCAAPSTDQLNDLRAMEWQYQTLARCLSQSDPWQALISEFPALQTICSELAVYRNYREGDLRRNLLRLYENYCAEWHSFSARRNFIRSGRRAA